MGRSPMGATGCPSASTGAYRLAVTGSDNPASSFRYGLVHETVLEMEILLGDGRIVVCSPSQNPDLFFGFPSSYGTLGYVLRLKIRLIPAQRYVHVRHSRFASPEAYFASVSEQRGIDYLDGTIFSANEMYLTSGRFLNEAPRVSDYTYLRIYYKSIQRNREDWLTAHGYIWRWDADWFWCSKHFYIQNPVLRLAAGAWALNSRTYQRIMRLSQRLLPESGREESVIQDVDIPIDHAPEFMRFLLKEIGITPVWVCPFKAYDPRVTFDLYALDPRKMYINFGFWDTVPTTHEDGYYNRKIEEKAQELEGKKGLYSTAYYDEETFWKIYNRDRYFELKRKYDPDEAFQDLYAKCVLGR
jgi:FAD/FMN-containing dehydrogenase